VIPYILSVLFLLCTLALIFAAFKIQLKLKGKVPSNDKDYWKKMSRTFHKGFITGAIGCGIAAAAILFRQAILAEISCITVLSAMIFPLALLSRRTAFKLCADSEKLQKKWQIILLFCAFTVLVITQLVFNYFNSLSK